MFFNQNRSIKSQINECNIDGSIINWCYNIYAFALPVFWSVCDKFPQLVVINNPSIPCQCMSIVLFLKQESAQWHGKMELSLRNASRSNLEKNC